VVKRIKTNACVTGTGRVVQKRTVTDRRVRAAGRIKKEGKRAVGRVFDANGVA
jgi:hypothetical protein